MSKTYLSLVIWTDIQVTKDGFHPDFLIKLLVSGSVVS